MFFGEILMFFKECFNLFSFLLLGVFLTIHTLFWIEIKLTSIILNNYWVKKDVLDSLHSNMHNSFI